jgi:RHS repeat-associated protein
LIRKESALEQSATMSEVTESEKAFERYLDSQKLAWHRVPETQQKQPDYRVEHKGKPCLFEVKEFGDPALKPIGGFSACPAIQEKITRARKQFKEYRQYSCAVVLWNSKSIYRTLLLDTVASAAFGKYVTVDAGPATDLRADPPRFQYSGPAELSESNNDYATARYYVNRNGRFSSTDPFGGSMTDPQRLNRYSYVENDPGNNSDPSGMFTLPSLGNSILGFLEGGLDGQCTEDGVDASCGSLGPLIASGGAESISGNSALLATGQGVNLGSSNEFDFLTLPVVLQGGYVGVHVSFNAGPTPGGWMDRLYGVHLGLIWPAWQRI